MDRQKNLLHGNATEQLHVQLKRNAISIEDVTEDSGKTVRQTAPNHGIMTTY